MDTKTKPVKYAAAANSSGPVSVSVIILTYNEAHRLRPCLESVAWADEVIVVDGGSADSTLDLARQFTPHVYVSDLLGPDRPDGYSDQRNFGLDKATGDWVFFLDADERITPELAEEIKSRLLGETEEGQVAYQMRRREYYFGVCTPYTHGEAWVDRLIRRGDGCWDGRLVHEGLLLQGTMGSLNGYLLHYSKDTVAQYVATMNRYTSLEAQEMMRNGSPLPRTPWPRMIHAFLYRYFHLGSYREGAFGLLMSLMFVFYSYLTWTKHWELCKNAGTIPGESGPARRTALMGWTLGGLWHGFSRIKARARTLGRASR